jgi:hypothetical protein
LCVLNYRFRGWNGEEAGTSSPGPETQRSPDHEDAQGDRQ